MSRRRKPLTSRFSVAARRRGSDEVDRAVEVLRRGGLVAFPTETVYGLGADATSPAAVRRIFDAKGRPPTNPLIAHVADESVARRYAAAWPPSAARLARRFWPGPLTLVVPRGEAIASEATAGRPTVGLRAPDHPLALELLRRFDGPVAAPSANRTNRVSPTTAQHVRDELGNAVDLILDGGPCRVGIESTVLDLTGDRPAILRPGGTSREAIEAEIGPVELLAGTVAATESAMSPGQQAVHYAPRARALRFEAVHRAMLIRLTATSGPRETGIVFVDDARLKRRLPGDHPLRRRANVAFMPDEPEAYAQRLYAVLRGLDDAGVHTIFIEMPPDAPEWLAVRDRLTRATLPTPRRGGRFA